MYKPTESTEVSALERAQILEALEHILSTDKFQAAPQMSAFLRYVVEQASSGNKNRIKAYTVAIDALGKSESFDPQNDPVVRVLAGRLRTSLSAYHEQNPSVPVSIIMKTGTYVPAFVFDTAYGASSQPNEKVIPLADGRNGKADNESLKPVEPLDQVDLTQPVNNQRQRQADIDGGPLDNTKERSAGAETAIEPGNTDLSQRELENAGDKPSKLGLKELAGSLIRSPIAAVIAGVVAVGILANHLSDRQTLTQQQQLVSDPAVAAVNEPVQIRPRPSSLSVFVSASDSANTLESQLKTMISGVFSESDKLQVFRMLDPTRAQQHWPEDYIVALDVLPMPEETRVTVQLVHAQTGQISYSETVLLSATADEGLSRQELSEVMNLTRRLVSEEGPMVTDYTDRMSRKTVEGD